MAISGPKPWVNPFGKMSIFRLCELLVFIAQKCVFSLQNKVKDIFLAYIGKKKLEKWPHLDQHHGLTHLEKCQFFDFLNFLFLQPRKCVFSFWNKEKKRVVKMAAFGPKPWVNSFGKMSIFRLFELLVFIAQEMRLFVLE